MFASSSGIIIIIIPNSSHLCYVRPAEWLGEYGEYAVQVQLNRSMALELQSRLSEQGVGVAGITPFSTAVEAPLRWGEAVPLWFIEQALKQQQPQEDEDEDDQGIERKTTSSTTYIILSQPTRRIEPGQMAADLRRLGEALSAFFEERTERVVVAISGGDHRRGKSSAPVFRAGPISFGEFVRCVVCRVFFSLFFSAFRFGGKDQTTVSSGTPFQVCLNLRWISVQLKLQDSRRDEHQATPSPVCDADEPCP